MPLFSVLYTYVGAETSDGVVNTQRYGQLLWGSLGPCASEIEVSF
jgi:hypothetical protein